MLSLVDVFDYDDFYHKKFLPELDKIKAFCKDNSEEFGNAYDLIKCTFDRRSSSEILGVFEVNADNMAFAGYQFGFIAGMKFLINVSFS